tara:strand:+ start:69 stop:353 length:285 start_codon:yes stop_codon:yes gene_type:complete
MELDPEPEHLILRTVLERFLFDLMGKELELYLLVGIRHQLLWFLLLHMAKYWDRFRNYQQHSSFDPLGIHHLEFQEYLYIQFLHYLTVDLHRKR